MSWNRHLAWPALEVKMHVYGVSTLLYVPGLWLLPHIAFARWLGGSENCEDKGPCFVTQLKKSTGEMWSSHLSLAWLMSLPWFVFMQKRCVYWPIFPLTCHSTVYLVICFLGLVSHSAGEWAMQRSEAISGRHHVLLTLWLIIYWRRFTRLCNVSIKGHI